MPDKRALAWYRPIKGDLIDELIAKHFNALRQPMPIKRLGDGNYIFGTRKIYVKLISGRLVVRVGGGFMSIEEFLSQYADMEMNKVRQMIENGTFNFDDFVEQIAEESSPNKGAPGHRRAKSKSPRNSGSPRANRQ